MFETEQYQDAAERYFALQSESIKVAMKQWETTVEAQKTMTKALLAAWAPKPEATS